MTMDIQHTIDMMANIDRQSRSRYHLTLGELITFLNETEYRGRGGKPVVFSDDYNSYPCKVESYRGYYSDLSLTNDGDIEGGATVTSLLNVLKAAIDEHFTGYKGGEFKMDENTPLWRSNYGQASDHAIVGVTNETIHIGGAVVLQIKRLDD